MGTYQHGFDKERIRMILPAPDIYPDKQHQIRKKALEKNKGKTTISQEVKHKQLKIPVQNWQQRTGSKKMPADTSKHSGTKPR